MIRLNIEKTQRSTQTIVSTAGTAIGVVFMSIKGNA